MSKVYKDRRGNEHTPQTGDTIKTRKGIFAVVVVKKKILLTWPYNELQSVDLPGGGIEEGEASSEALLREVYEETGLEFSALMTQAATEQDVAYYAADQGEYWDYSQRFEVLTPSFYESFMFAGKRDTPEKGFASWEDLDDLHKHDMQYFHLQALRKLSIV